MAGMSPEPPDWLLPSWDTLPADPDAEPRRPASPAGTFGLRVQSVSEVSRAAAEVTTTVAVAHTLVEGIRTTVHEQRADLLLLGWQADASSHERLFGPPIDAFPNRHSAHR